MALEPVCRSQIGDFLVRHGREALKNIFEIGAGVDVEHPAGFYQTVDHRVSLAAFLVPHEHPVLLPDRRWSDRVLDQIVVDLHFAVINISAQQLPLLEGIAQRLAHRALRQIPLD